MTYFLFPAINLAIYLDRNRSMITMLIPLWFCMGSASFGHRVPPEPIAGEKIRPHAFFMAGAVSGSINPTKTGGLASFAVKIWRCTGPFLCPFFRVGASGHSGEAVTTLLRSSARGGCGPAAVAEAQYPLLLAATDGRPALFSGGLLGPYGPDASSSGGTRCVSCWL